MAASSPDALGVVRNLPGRVACAALHPPAAPTRAVLDLQHDLEYSGIGLGGELALPGVAAALRVEWVGPNTIGEGLAIGFDPAHAACLPKSALDLLPFDRNVGS